MSVANTAYDISDGDWTIALTRPERSRRKFYYKINTYISLILLICQHNVRTGFGFKYLQISNYYKCNQWNIMFLLAARMRSTLVLTSAPLPLNPQFLILMCPQNVCWFSVPIQKPDQPARGNKYPSRSNSEIIDIRWILCSLPCAASSIQTHRKGNIY